jgi:hypothetical protein
MFNIKKPNINVPFRIKIPAGSSTFTVPVPKAFNDRLYHFSDLVLVADYYSLLAFDYGLDVQEELDEMVDYSFFLTCPMAASPYGPDVVMPASVKTTLVTAKWINDKFEEIKPEGLIHLGMFFDWTDLRYVPSATQTWDDWIVAMATSYYGVPYSPDLHFNKLPLSARTVKGSNNYLFPTTPTEEDEANIRFRMHLSPNAKIQCSTDGHLFDMGFSIPQIGNRIKSRYNFINEESNRFAMIQAEDALII